MSSLETIEDFHTAYRVKHEKDALFCSGHSIRRYIEMIAGLCNGSNITTAIDYGCGKATLHKECNLAYLFGWKRLDLYDPGVARYSEKLTEPADLVMCVDVLEHIPEFAIDDVLKELESLTNKALFLVISTRPAKKHIAEGVNAHVTVQPEKWWNEKLSKLKVYYKVVYAG